MADVKNGYEFDLIDFESAPRHERAILIEL